MRNMHAKSNYQLFHTHNITTDNYESSKKISTEQNQDQSDESLVISHLRRKFRTKKAIEFEMLT